MMEGATTSTTTTTTTTGLAGESPLEAFLLEFDRAVRAFERRGSAQHEPPPEAWQTGLPPGSLSDSGIDDAGSRSISPGSSLNSSEDDLRAGVASSHSPSSTAKLGDTGELEAFIADLDQILKDM